MSRSTYRYAYTPWPVLLVSGKDTTLLLSSPNIILLCTHNTNSSSIIQLNDPPIQPHQGKSPGPTLAALESKKKKNDGEQQGPVSGLHYGCAHFNSPSRTFSEHRTQAPLICNLCSCQNPRGTNPKDPGDESTHSCFRPNITHYHHASRTAHMKQDSQSTRHVTWQYAPQVLRWPSFGLRTRP